jgi:acyl carrier protein
VGVEAGDIIAVIKSAGVLADVTPEKKDMSFKTLGIDSLDMYNILMQIEEKYQTKIPDGDIEKLSSVDAVVKYLNGVES